MRPRQVLATLVAALAAGSAQANAGRNGTPPMAPTGSLLAPVDLPTDGKWYYSATNFATEGPDTTGSWMSVPDQDTLWKVSSTDSLSLMITDSWITGDRFEVYVDSTKVLTTPAVASNVLPEIEPDAPSTDPPKAFVEQQKLTDSFAAPRYSSGTVQIPPGVHTINVKSIAYPPGLGGAGFGLRAVPKSPTATRPTTWGAVKALYR